MISVYPFGDELYAFTESPIIHRINQETLETEKKINISEYVAVVNHTSHPHVMEDGTQAQIWPTVMYSIIVLKLQELYTI